MYSLGYTLIFVFYLHISYGAYYAFDILPII